MEEGSTRCRTSSRASEGLLGDRPGERSDGEEGRGGPARAFEPDGPQEDQEELPEVPEGGDEPAAQVHSGFHQVPGGLLPVAEVQDDDGDVEGGVPEGEAGGPASARGAKG
ncbi:uncharacterized protein A4U43_C08F7940 [Asparagus officinalis]|nr:uncharacterized protein A4U43_C08F7940 [Asparagus officinalis]